MVKNPKNLQTHLGKEFYYTEIKMFMQSFSINYYSTFPTLKANVFGWAIQTMKNLTWKQCALQVEGEIFYPNSSVIIITENIPQQHWNQVNQNKWEQVNNRWNLSKLKNCWKLTFRIFIPLQTFWRPKVEKFMLNG